MTSRRALIIGAPDEKIPGVNSDIKNLRTHLKSPIGGLWHENEIITLISPSVNEVRKEINVLKSKDYSVIFFAGHGYYSIQRKCTIVNLNSRETLDSFELRCGAQKHTLILDCCRKPENERRLLKAAMESMTLDYAMGQRLNPLECRKYFDKEISDCDPGIIIMNSCSINETAGENEIDGGYYTSSLIDSANEWTKNKLMAIDLTKEYVAFSTQEIHNAASVKVKLLSGNRQNPIFESPRSDKKFPFAVVA